MLAKLIKYDLKYIYKQLIIFYIIVISCAIIARLTTVSHPPFVVFFIHMLMRGSAFGFALGAFINAVMRTWARFRSTYYGDESYLIHTLPISPRTLWASKFLSGLIVIFLSLLMLLSAVFIMFSSDFIDFISTYNRRSLFLIFIFAVFCQLLFILQAGFTGIILGHRRNDKRIPRSVIWALICYLVGEIILIGIVMLLAIFIPSLHDLLFGDLTPGNIDGAKQLLISITLIYVALITASYFVSAKLLQKGVDVD